MKSAFTLTELIITLIIIGILVSLALPLFTRAMESTRANEAKAALEQIRAGERIYRTSEGYYYPHSADHSSAEEDEATINSFLKLFLDTREKDWKYKVDTDTADDFTATATRTSGGNQGETVTIDQSGPPFGGTWSP